MTSSSLTDINHALLSHNPFARPPYVNAQNIWGKGLPDVESLNAHASDAVFQALEQIHAGYYSTTSILITAQDGTGKTHIISRIRHHLQQDQRGALFVLVNKFDDLNRPKQGFQRLLADSLGNIGSKNVRQWQELATDMANEAIKVNNPHTKSFEPKDLVKKFEESSEEKAFAWVDRLKKIFCSVKNVKDPDIVRAIFWTLSNDYVLDAIKWLGGSELAQFKANELKLPTQNQSFEAVLQILDLISESKKLVICFDELDPLQFNDAGLHISQVVAGLVKELFENLKQGVILSVMMPGTWRERVKQHLPGGVWSKMAAQGEPLDLKYMDGDSVVELVSLFLKDYYDAKTVAPPYPLYPFDEYQLREIGKNRPTVREVLLWCRDNCKPPVDRSPEEQDPPLPPPEPASDPVELIFQAVLENLDNYLDNNALIADALLFGFQTFIGQTVDNVMVEEVTEKVKPVKKGRGKDPYLNFKIIGKDNGQPVRIGVAVLQYEGGTSLGAGFKRLLDLDGFSLTRGCLVRTKQGKQLSSYIKKNYLTPLIAMGGEFADLKEEEIKPLIAMLEVYRKRETDYNLTEEQISQFIIDQGAKHLLGIHNPLLKEILSDPSYQVPDIEDEPEPTVYLESPLSDTLEDLEDISNVDWADLTTDNE